MERLESVEKSDRDDRPSEPDESLKSRYRRTGLMLGWLSGITMASLIGYGFMKLLIPIPEAALPDSEGYFHHVNVSGGCDTAFVLVHGDSLFGHKILRTINGGAGWTVVHQDDSIYCNDMSVDWRSGKTIALGLTRQAKDVVLRSTDFGATWS